MNFSFENLFQAGFGVVSMKTFFQPYGLVCCQWKTSFSQGLVWFIWRKLVSARFGLVYMENLFQPGFGLVYMENLFQPGFGLVSRLQGSVNQLDEEYNKGNHS